MRARIFASSAALACAWMLLAGSGCPLIPEAEERTVELAVVGSAVQEFQARGIINTYAQEEEFNLGQDIDIREILDDNGVDVAVLTELSLAAVYVRCTVPDPNPGRHIADGTVAVGRDGGALASLVSDFELDVDTATDWTEVSLAPAGVSVLNDALDDLLADLKAGVDSDITLKYAAAGVSQPTGASTSFDWELRVDLNIVGTVTVDIYH